MNMDINFDLRSIANITYELFENHCWKIISIGSSAGLMDHFFTYSRRNTGIGIVVVNTLTMNGASPPQKIK